jgi:hypothetical protein
MRATALKHYVPLAAWIVVIFTLLCVTGKIIGYGFLPPDDALVHAAKVISGKPWSEILVLRDGFVIDPHPGWQAILELTHRWLDCNTETLVVLPVAGLMFLFSLAALIWLRWPESWLGAMLMAAIFSPTFIGRLALGRPYVFTMAVYLVLLGMWARLEERRPGFREILATLFLIAAAAWVHGSFYQLLLPAAGLLLAGRWRQAFRFGALWAAGSFLGASFTGHPWLFLDQCVRHLFGVFGDYTLTNQLVGELTPTDGEGAMVLVVAAMLLWRARSPDWKARELANPIFMMGLLGWVLGLKVGRFWSDWGLPATVLWLALALQKQFEHDVAFDSWQRLLVTLGLAVAVFLGITSDRSNRWTWNISKQYLMQDNADLKGWLPENGGIIYSVDMAVFDETFFKNPTAPWRYALGFESALMRPEDLAVVRKVQWNSGDLRAYEPWVKKMRRPDRLIISAAWLPTTGPARTVASIPELEWFRADNGWSIGRLPQKPASAKGDRR